MKKNYLLLILFGLSTVAFGQSTFKTVYDIFQANCTVGCHSGPSPDGQMNLSGPIMDVYAELINATPVNPEAIAKGYKLVNPGYPERSFLFTKVAHDIDPTGNYLTPSMGSAMPEGLLRMDYDEIEMIRQWILYGAGDTTYTYLDPQIVTDFYNSNGLPRITPLPLPDPSEGFQLHYGPFFLNPLTENEFMYKYETELPITKEVNRIHTKINDESHHTALYRYFPLADSVINPGLRPVLGLLDAAQVFFASDILGQWPNDQDLVLPEGVAFTWPQNTVLDLNYHLVNYSQSSILAGEFYMNVYTQDQGTAEAELKSLPVYYGGSQVFDLIIPPGDTTFTINQFDTATSNSIYLWSIMAHTHKFGTEFDVWKRNPNGSKGEKIYNGHYNADYTHDQGYYDWQHAPFRTFEPLLEINLSEGLIHEATFHNPGPNTINFGLTSEDEMFVTYLQYTDIPVTSSVAEKETGFAYFNAYPNPSNDVINLSFVNSKGATGLVSVYDNLGREIFRKIYPLNIGLQQIQLSKENMAVSAGLYTIKLSTDGANKVVKVMFE